MMIKSLPQFNYELKKRGIPTELVKGRGYFYFVPTDDHCFEPNSIFVCHFYRARPEFWGRQLREVEQLWKEVQ